MMIDQMALRAVFGKGDSAPPGYKCEKGIYKKLLVESIRSCGIRPAFGGREYAGDIVDSLDLEHGGNADESLERLITDVRGFLNRWGSSER
jgi:hypothetical protein